MMLSFITPIVDIFNNHTVCVVGMKGTGKDVLFGNVIARRKLPYCSNMDYGYNFIPFVYRAIVPKVDFKQLIRGKFEPYLSPLADNTDIYLSDCGVYFPSQYCSELNKLYPEFPIYDALSRQLSETRIHSNCQNLNRVWDKIREHADIYINCNWICKPLMKLGLVVQIVTIYDKYDSAANRVRPCRIHVGFLDNQNVRTSKQIYIDDFFNKHGTVERKILIYSNKSKHDTRYFKKFFERGGSCD